MTKTQKKNQKPIEIDAHFKYKCPDHNCGYNHWLSLKEVKTKNFKVVCDCGLVFKPKQIKKINIVYVEITTNPQPENQEITQIQVVEKPKIPVDLQNNCVKLLVDYGFTEQEALDLVIKGFDKNPVSSGSLLVKYILQNLEELNVIN